MGKRNFLIEGGSCTGKTSVCDELQRRGYHAVNGDRVLAYQGDPKTGEPVEGMTGAAVHDHHIWDLGKVRALVVNDDHEVTFLCGGSRNFPEFIDLLDGVFILEIDLDTLNRRLDDRAEDEWGGRAAERELVVRLHGTKQDLPKLGTVIDATAPIAHVVDEIVRRSECTWSAPGDETQGRLSGESALSRRGASAAEILDESVAASRTRPEEQ